MAKKKRKNRSKQGQRRHVHPGGDQSWLKTGAIIAAVGATLVGVLFLTRPSTPSVDASVRADERAIGPATAPITVIEYGDFGCPACRAWHQAGIREQILAQYGDQVRFVWRDFPVITPRSPQAAEAGLCAHDQGRFWEYHDLIFERAFSIGEADLKAHAAEIGLDTAQFNQCLDSGQHRAAVQQDYQNGRTYGLRGTPSFLVNGNLLPAPPSFAYLQQVIDDTLASQ